MENLPNQWMIQQQQAGRRLCLILEANNAACQPMLSARGFPAYCRLYAQTPLAEMATAGPVILLLDQVGEPALLDLLQEPEMNWGWLGSLPNADLTDMSRHWRDRLLVGPESNRTLYRLHDNRTLARALNHLGLEQWPAFLGPLISVCYWHEGRWHCGDNPAPGDYPVPEPAPWLNTPNPNASAILHANILRYLLAEHSEDLAALIEAHDPRIWLTQLLEQARAWQWSSPEQLEFLVVRRLQEATRSSVILWQPMFGETPQDHFERVMQQWHMLEKKDE